MDITKILQSREGALIIAQSKFLERKFNLFPSDIPLFVYGVTDKAAVYGKLKEFYSPDEITQTDGGLLAQVSAPLHARTRFTFSDLEEIIFKLRDPDGCLWDRAQSNMSIRTNAIEEAYELAEAVETGEDSKIIEESGDVLLQGVFNAVIAQGEGRFSVGDVISGLCLKLIRRHTHIFGADKARDEKDALKFWEKAKSIEKAYNGTEDKLKSVPVTFGALMRANKVQKIIAKTGFDFPDAESALNKIYEEVEEFKNAEGHEAEKEGGDILFAAVNTLRMAKIDPELALSGAVNRFIARFNYMQSAARKMGTTVEELDLDGAERLYAEAKKALGHE